MKSWLALSLAALLWPVAGAAADDTVTVHRCVDGKGRVSLQNEPCAAGSQDQTRQMQRPKDPPAKPATPPPAPPPPDYEPLAYPSPYQAIPPPVLYRCTSYDGIVRYSESNDPNPHCEPLGLYYPDQRLSAEQAGACRWVQDSCLRLSDADSCTVWQQKNKEATSKALHAFSDTAAYWKSERERTEQILRESCQ